MVNEHEANEAHEDALTPRCGYCGHPLVGKGNRAQYCNRRCKELAAKKRRAVRERVDTYRAKYPEAAHAWDGLPDDDNDQGQDAGPPEYDTDNRGWSDMWRLHEAEQDIWARYDALAAPYRAQMRRNPGVKLPGLVALERERDREIAAVLTDTTDGLTNTGNAGASQSRADEASRRNEARARHSERAALQALGKALPGHRSGHVSYRSRETHDLWAW